MRSKLIQILVLSFHILLAAQPVQEYQNHIGMEFILIHGGKYLMGSPEAIGRKNEHPQHRVTITYDFYIGKYEVTQEQWQKIMNVNPSHNQGKNHPVETITYAQIHEFIEKLNQLEQNGYYRLPTEAEWEYTCRGGSTKHYYWGGESIKDSANYYAWHGGNSGGKTHEVGTKLANPFGLFDMIGNVWEWCSDWYADDYYQYSPSVNPQGPEKGDKKVMRGNDFVNGWRACYSTLRVGADPTRNDREDIGFRLVFISSSKD